VTARARRHLAPLLLAAAACGGGDARATSPATPAPVAPPATTSSTGPAATSSTTPTTTATTAPSTTATVAGPAPAAPPTAIADPAAVDPRIAPVSAADLPSSWRPGCPVGPEDLRAVTVTHLGFDGLEHAGVLVVHEDHAAGVLGVFDQLLAFGFPVERIEPVDAHGGSDDASMAVNNTSAFNCRPVTGGTGWSRHAYGTAIDLNPRQNPYVTGDGTVLPPEGASYLDRSPQPGVIRRGDGVVEAFAAIGWRWGGDWTDPVDYQHFDVRP
jgi:hypothetical protein